MSSVRVLIPYRDTGDRDREANAEVVARWWRDLVGYTPTLCDDPEDRERFNRGRAFLAHLRLHPPMADDVLVLADGDLIPQRHAIERAVGILALQPTVWAYAVPFTTVEYLDQPTTELVRGGVDPHDADVDVERTWDRLSTGGINIVPGSTWHATGGFDPRFHGWGFEDAAFDAAARTLTAKRTLHVGGPVIHLHHPPSPETNPRDPGYQRSLELCHRYEQVDGDPDAMRRLTMDWRTP